MRIAIGCDHVGFPLKASIGEALDEEQHAVLDLGTHGPDPVDYPPMAKAVATAIGKGFVEIGLLLCDDGIGGSIAANKFPGIRAVACQDPETARHCRERLNANLLCLGASGVAGDAAVAVVRAWLSAQFAGDEHDVREIDKIGEIEESLRRGGRGDRLVDRTARPAARSASAVAAAPSSAHATTSSVRPAPPEEEPVVEPPRAPDITPVLKFVGSLKDGDLKAMATRMLELLRNRFPSAAGAPTPDGFSFTLNGQHVATVTIGKNFIQLEAGPDRIPSSRIRDIDALDFALQLPSIENALNAVKV